MIFTYISIKIATKENLEENVLISLNFIFISFLFYRVFISCLHDFFTECKKARGALIF